VVVCTSPASIRTNAASKFGDVAGYGVLSKLVELSHRYVLLPLPEYVSGGSTTTGKGFMNVLGSAAELYSYISADRASISDILVLYCLAGDDGLFQSVCLRMLRRSAAARVASPVAGFMNLHCTSNVGIENTDKKGEHAPKVPGLSYSFLVFLPTNMLGRVMSRSARASSRFAVAVSLLDCCESSLESLRGGKPSRSQICCTGLRLCRCRCLS